MVLNTEWSQVEIIDLVNDGSGLGFGIVGGKSTGVVIKSILPGGIADKDSRLQSGDHILQIGDIHLRGLGSEQVASVLRQAGAQVRMVVARPVEPTSLDYQALSGGSAAPIVPTKILTDPEELDRQLLVNGYSLNTYDDDDDIEDSQTQNPYNYGLTTSTNVVPTITENEVVIQPVTAVFVDRSAVNNVYRCTPCDDIEELPETEKFTVELRRNEYGLGITVAGYVCEREDLSGIFVKSVSEGSAAHKCRKINLNDRIIEVNGESLNGFNNHQAVEKLKCCGEAVVLTLERYLRGPKYDHLLEALACQEVDKVSSPPSPSVTTLSWFPVDAEIEPEGESVASVTSEVYHEDDVEVFVDENFKANLTEDDEIEAAIKQKWEVIVGKESKIIVAQLEKLKGLGISLEGTVDVEGGVELRPHHYIRSILPEGPVGQNKKLSPGDELLEVNGQRLLGIKHTEVVKILKELPSTVRIVCSRNTENESTSRLINTSQDREAFATRSILGGSLKTLLPHPERLIKALSDSSINTSSTATITDENGLEKAKSRSKSLETTNLAMWSDQVDTIDLMKTDKGLGFSILDYQDPLDPNASIIVVRSLVPNGSAENDGRLKPGDRLMTVNDIDVKNASLDEAVRALKATLPGVVKIGIAKPLTMNSRQNSGS